MIAVVTGGSRGIGAEVAMHLAGAGHDVALTCQHNFSLAEAVAAKCQALGVRAKAYQADVSSEDDAAELIQKINTDLGTVGILVNNAGITRDGLAMRMKLAQFTEVLDINLTGTFIMAKAVLPGMIKARQGRIINMTSVAGLYGNAGQANYSAAKAGVIGLTRSLAKEVASRQITVNAVAPGFIETDMTSALSDKLREQAILNIGLGRLGKPEDIAPIVTFLASEQASYITGQVIEVSGGLRL